MIELPQIKQILIIRVHKILEEHQNITYDCLVLVKVQQVLFSKIICLYEILFLLLQSISNVDEDNNR